MTRTDHPLTETAAARLWYQCADGLTEGSFSDLTVGMEHAFYKAMRAAFDAGREHEREHADPHHDPRPWQDCTVGDIREGDLVETCINGTRAIGIAHHQDWKGDWCTEGGNMLTWDDRWPLRRIPAPTDPRVQTIENADPGDVLPGDHLTRVSVIKVNGVTNKSRRTGTAHHRDKWGAWHTEDGGWLTAGDDEAGSIIITIRRTIEEITLPTEHPAHITDVEDVDGDTCAYMAIDIDGDWIGVDQDGDVRACGHTMLAAFTLPDGTRACRDGDHEDGTPRFVKMEDDQ